MCVCSFVLSCVCAGGLFVAMQCCQAVVVVDARSWVHDVKLFACNMPTARVVMVLSHYTQELFILQSV